LNKIERGGSYLSHFFNHGNPIRFLAFLKEKNKSRSGKNKKVISGILAVEF